MSEKPVHSRPRRLVDWISLMGTKKVHSLIDKVYKRKNLEMAWEKVKANRGSGGVDGQNLEVFEAQLNQQLERLRRELKEDTYQPLPVPPTSHPEAGSPKPGEYRLLGTPAIYAAACANKPCSIGLEPIFEPVFDDSKFRISARAISEGCLAQSVERDTKRVRVDRGCGSPRFSGPRTMKNSSRWLLNE